VCCKKDPDTMKNSLKLAVLGSGYVANVTGACFASMGFKVTCAGLEADRMESLQKGEVPFFEEGLEAIVKSELANGMLTYTTDVAAACKEANIIFLSISAPPLPDGQPDLGPINQILKAMAPGFETGYKLVVQRSNLPVESGSWLKSELVKLLPEGSTCEVDIAAVPQFLREGQSVHDFFNPDRLIIGTNTQKAKDLLLELYSGISAPMLMTDVITAELIKHATNAYLAMKISFINSIAQISEKVGSDIGLVAKGLGMDKRISPHFLNAGLGYGGIFLPRDVTSLGHLATKYHMSFDLLKATETVNRYQRIRFIERISEACGGQLAGKTIAIWGLAYRPNTDDMRDCPSTQVIWGLQNRGATIRAYDPIAMGAAKEKVRRVKFAESIYEAAEGADVIAILTEWPEFAQLNFSQLKESTTCRLVVDGRNLFAPVRMAEQGFTYHSVGRAVALPNQKK
jgi:UDPglucose 6-dehydrogenase